MNETTITKRILAALRARGAYAFKIHGHPMQQAGLPDICAVYQGRAIFLEVKREGQYATRLQQHTLNKLAECGALAYVIRSEEEAMGVLDLVGVDNDSTKA